MSSRLITQKGEYAMSITKQDLERYGMSELRDEESQKPVIPLKALVPGGGTFQKSSIAIGPTTTKFEKKL